VKMLSKVIVILAIAIVVVGGGIAAYLLTRGPEVYELSYNFKPGESYVYEMKSKTESLGTSVELSLSETLDVLQVIDHEVNIRDSSEMQIAITGAAQQNVAVVMTFRMTNKGVRSAIQIEKVEPPELRTAMEQARGQLEGYLKAIYHYPTDPVPLGREWSVPIDYQFEQAGVSMTVTGEARSSIVARESITVQAGTFDCWRLAHKINASGEMVLAGQTVTMSMSGNATSWIDPLSGAQTKADLPLSMKLKAAGQELEVPVNVTMELIKHQGP